MSLTDTWIYAPHLDTWLDITPEKGPSPPPGHPAYGNSVMWYDPPRNLIVLFSGNGQTWTCTITPKN